MVSLHKKLMVIFILVLAGLLGTACSGSMGIAVQSINPFESSALEDEDQKPDSPALARVISDEQGNSLPQGMLAFDGRVFVASTRPSSKRWHLAGWQIADTPIAGEGESLPADCTLYPHQGVDNQWIGSCSGHTFIPRDGANHIAVVHTSQDGTTTLVQVAPPTSTGQLQPAP